MVKKRTVCSYNLLLAIPPKISKEQVEKNLIGNFLGKEIAEKIEEKDWKVSYRTKKITQEGYYLLVNFDSPRKEIPPLIKNLSLANSKKFFSRYELINLTEERNKI